MVEHTPPHFMLPRGPPYGPSSRPGTSAGSLRNPETKIADADADSAACARSADSADSADSAPLTPLSAPAPLTPLTPLR